MKKYDEEVQRLLKEVVEECRKEDQSVRERQIRTWKKLKLTWEGFQRIWYSDLAHDWRVWDQEQEQQSDQSSYDRPVNIFRAYLESIIAALSVTVPPLKCFPDDADNTLDLATARAGDKIAELISRHNNASLLWLHSLFIYCTEGMIAGYNYNKEDEEYGTYTENKYEDITEHHQITSCSICGAQLDDQQIPEPSQQPGQQSQQPQQNNQSQQNQPDQEDQEDKFQPGQDDVAVDNAGELCPNCLQMMNPQIKQDSFIVTRLVDSQKLPKSRVHLEIYGGLNIKVPNYARCQKECPYLQYSYEKSYTLVMEEYPDLRDNEALRKQLTSNNTGGYSQYDQWGRLSPQYQNEYPTNIVTCENTWLRPAQFNVLSDDEDVKHLKKLFPFGVKVVFVNDEYAEAKPEAMDDYWTLIYNPLSDYIHFDPLGLLLTSLQEITNDLVSLTLQTIEHGVGLTFADPAVFDFNAYAQTEVVPGAMFPATPKSGKSLSDGFYEVKTATLSGEVMPFSQNIQSMAQLVSGATPSIFGGQLQGAGGETASGYSMSRAQALQRLQNQWKMLTAWWKTVFSKAVPMYIKNIKEDEHDVQRDDDGNFINVFIRKAELEGKIGKIELEANEALPQTWSQVKDTVMKLMESQNPEVLKIIAAPENLPYLREAIGLTDSFIPGEDDREKQYDEIKELLNSEPITVPVPPELIAQAQQGGVPEPQPQQIPSVEIDPDFDNHQIEFEICRNWIIGPAGRQAKVDNPQGYLNVLLHGKMHLDILKTPPPIQPVAPKINYNFKGEDVMADSQIREILDRSEQLSVPSPQQGSAPSAKPNELNREAPIMGEQHVNTVQ